MNERTHFSQVAGIMVRIREVTDADRGLNPQLNACELVLVRVDCGRIVAMLHANDLFDNQGNRFAY